MHAGDTTLSRLHCTGTFCTRTQKNSEYVVYIEVVQLQVKTLGSGMG